MALYSQVATWVESAGQHPALRADFWRYVSSAHAAAVELTADHPHQAQPTSAAAATDRHAVMVLLLHGRQHRLLCIALEMATAAYFGDMKGLSHGSPQMRLNSAERVLSALPSAAVKKRSMKMSRSNSLPCINVVMAASIIGGGPHR